MTLSMYTASIPVFLRGLDVLSVVLERAVAYAAARDFDVDILVGARLAPDMLPLSGQIQRASDTAKFAAARLTDLPSPRFADTEVTLEDLRQRIDVPLLDLFQIRFLLEPVTHRLRQLLVQFADSQCHRVSAGCACRARGSIESDRCCCTQLRAFVCFLEFQKRFRGFLDGRLKFGQPGRQ